MTSSDDHRRRMAHKKAAMDRRIAAADRRRGVVVVHTGPGKGKSSAAFGMAARALGHGLKVGVVQFIKSPGRSGEERFFRDQPGVAFHVMGEGFSWETGDRERDRRAAHAAWERARGLLADPETALVILDELNIILKQRLLECGELLAALAARPPLQHVCITGRHAPPELIAAADTVTEMHSVKHAFQNGIAAQPGVEF